MNEGTYLYKVKQKKQAFVRVNSGQTWCDYPYPVVEYGFLYIDNNGIGTLETSHIILGQDYMFEPIDNGRSMKIVSSNKLATLTYNKEQKNTNIPHIRLVKSSDISQNWQNIVTHEGGCYADIKLGVESYFYYIDSCSTSAIEYYDTSIQPIKLTYHNGQLNSQYIQFSSDDNY